MGLRGVLVGNLGMLCSFLLVTLLMMLRGRLVGLGSMVVMLRSFVVFIFWH